MLLGKPERLGHRDHTDRIAVRSDQADFRNIDFTIQTMGAFFRDIPALERSDGSNLSIDQ
jgi:hypothetical protein